MDPVRIVAAAPDAEIVRKGGFGGRKLVVASEYENLTKKWLTEKKIEATFLRAYGATESLPPEDADIIVDNAATGSTLKANNLEVFDTLMTSTTRLYASAEAWANPAKRSRIEKFVMLLKAVLEARKRLMITFNIPSEKLESLLGRLPSARAPTVSPLHHGSGFAVQVAVEAGTVPALIPEIKAEGGSDIAVSTIKMLVA
jgi:ATP phosphoribosyltransferase